MFPLLAPLRHGDRPDDVRFQGKTGSSRPMTKMTRLTHNGLWPPARETTRVWALCGPEQSRARLYRVPSSGFHVSSDLTGGDKNMRYALVIAMLLGSTLLAQAEPIDRDKWIAQTARASKSCLAKFRQKFGEDKGHNYSNCVTDQTNKAIDDCVGSSEFSNCVLEKSLRVLEVCDLSSC